MVLLISPEQIELESCACAQIEARGEGNRWVYAIRYLGFIRKAGYCNIKKSLPFWSWFWIVLPFHHPNQPYYRDEGFCYTTDFLLALWVILGETNYMTHSFIQLVPFLCKLLIVVYKYKQKRMYSPKSVWIVSNWPIGCHAICKPELCQIKVKHKNLFVL